jgi:hypothetical protein
MLYTEINYQLQPKRACNRHNIFMKTMMSAYIRKPTQYRIIPLRDFMHMCNCTNSGGTYPTVRRSQQMSNLREDCHLTNMLSITLDQWTSYVSLNSDWGYIFLTDPTEQMSPNPHMRMETDPFSETLCTFMCFLEYQMMEKVQNPSDPECYTPSSEPFKTNMLP